VVASRWQRSRLWPASRALDPKQLLPLGPGGETWLAAAIRRGQAIAGPRVVVVTAESQLDATRQAVAVAFYGPVAYWLIRRSPVAAR